LATAIADDNSPATVTAIRERVLDKATKDQSPLWLPKKFASYKQFIASCDASVRQTLSDSKTFGPDPAGWVWGKVSVARFPHPLAGAPLIGGQFAIAQVPIPGSGQTPNVGSSVSMRLIASPGNWDATRHVIPLGESGDSRSPFFKDQFQAWLTDDPPAFPFSDKAIESAAKETAVYSPK
jgi:acyl-homoserine lactone acylase PvdQ